MQIHELNNYNGTLDSSAYLAVDNGSDTGKVSTTELLAEANAAVSQLDTFLNGRIDNIIAGGEAPSASEIVDARYGADGVTYPSLGAAIRDQVTDLKSDLVGLNNNISRGTPTLLTFDWTHGQNWKNENNILIASMSYRVCNSNPFSYPVDLTITHEGFDIELYMDTTHDNTFDTHVSWRGEPYTIPANTPTYIGIKRTTEDKSENASIEEFVNALIISPILANESEFQETKQMVYGSDYVTATADTTYTGKYINKDGGIADLAKYTILGFNLDKNDVLEINSSNGISDASVIAFISIWKNGVFQYVFGDSVDGSATKDIFIANESCEVRVVTRNNNTAYAYSFRKSIYAEGMANYIDKLIANISEVTASILSAFGNITCIGDSLTWSQVYTSASASRQAFNPYPKVIENLTGVTTTNLATAGDSASDWWSEYENQIIQKDGQITLIYLGTNGGLNDTMDVDMVGDDYSAWADTNTGCYGKIIAKSLAIGSRVVLIKVHSSSGNVATTNSVIEKMANRFNVPFIENDFLSGVIYHSYPDNSGTNGTHYNDIGYTVFARQVIDKISNLSDADILKILPM